MTQSYLEAHLRGGWRARLMRGVMLAVSLFGSGLFVSSNERLFAQEERKQEARHCKGVRVVRAVSPDYPLVSRIARIGDSIVVEAEVNSLGDVRASRAVSGDRTLRPAAEQAARKWEFATSEDSIEACQLNLIFRFTLLPEDTPPEQLTVVFMPPFEVEIQGVRPKPKTVITHPSVQVNPDMR